jgi:hypothetical protein
MLSPMIGGPLTSAAASDNMSKLTPSVYSHAHPSVQDPVLNRRGQLEMTSSGAFFDPRAVSKQTQPRSGGDLTSISNSDIIAKLTKEMMSSSEAVSSNYSTGSVNQLNQQPPAAAASNSLREQQNVINKLNLSPAKSAASGYKSELAEIELAALRSSVAASKKAAVAANSSRLSLVGTNIMDKTINNSEKNNSLSRSQPDLFNATSERNDPELEIEMRKKSENSPVYANTVTASTAAASIAASSEVVVATSQMSAFELHQMESYKAENDKLKDKISEFNKKISRVANLEQEMAKIHQAYQNLLKHSEKREYLEKSARAKLQAVIISLSDANKVCKDFL